MASIYNPTCPYQIQGCQTCTNTCEEMENMSQDKSLILLDIISRFTHIILDIPNININSLSHPIKPIVSRVLTNSSDQKITQVYLGKRKREDSNSLEEKKRRKTSEKSFSILDNFQCTSKNKNYLYCLYCKSLKEIIENFSQSEVNSILLETLKKINHKKIEMSSIQTFPLSHLLSNNLSVNSTEVSSSSSSSHSKKKFNYDDWFSLNLANYIPKDLISNYRRIDVINHLVYIMLKKNLRPFYKELSKPDDFKAFKASFQSMKRKEKLALRRQLLSLEKYKGCFDLSRSKFFGTKIPDEDWVQY